MHDPMPRLRSTPGRWLAIAALAAAYFLSARLLISLSTVPAGPVTTVWLPSGISVAALVLCGPLAAFGAFIGAVAAALAMHTPGPLAVVLSVGNTAGELLAWWIVAGRRNRGFSIDQVADGPRLAAAALAAGAVSATVSVTGYLQYGFIPAHAYVANWLSWMASGASSIVLVTPLLVYSARWREQPWQVVPRSGEYVSALGLLLAGALAWQGPMFERGVDEPAILLLIASQLWIAFRFSPAAMTLSNGMIGVAAVVGLVLRLGHAPPATAYPFILSLQLMLCGLGLTGYLLAAMVARQRRSAQALQEAQGALVSGARDAGRAEIATNVLHNVGNVLNSVNVSAQVLLARVRETKAQRMARAVQLLDEHRGDLGGYLTQDSKGKLLPAYLGELAKALDEERQESLEELQLLLRNIGHIKDVIDTQQGYAGVSTVLEPVRLSEVVQDALRLDADALARAGVTVEREFADVPVAPLDKTRIIQILVNLISNARQAMAACAGPRRLTVQVGQDGNSLFVTVADVGEGIAPENLTRIFSHGFTSREGGHGFGLHSCVLASRDMGGTLTASSAGPGLGSTFTLKLPVNSARS